MVIENNTILYFSGTGNSLQVAKDIGNSIGGFDLLKITVLENEEKIVVKTGVLGIVFPVYYARLPLVVEKTIKKLELSKGVYVFAVATYGGAPATVLKKLERILGINGISLNAGFLVHMPKNHVFEYNTKPVKAENWIFKREKEKIKKISDMVREKRNSKCEISRLIIDTIVDKAFTAITDKIMDTINIRDTKFWVNENCNGCRLCEKICSVKNIEFKTEPIWRHNCERCTACIQFCPKEAIQWGNKTVNRKRYRNPNVDIKELTN
ncbi:MAG: EFR1 family ferrodoxin [Clostridia bacterium]|nr:EFR1 family ferrodoxin [Clostridia bacterium]